MNQQSTAAVVLLCGLAFGLTVLVCCTNPPRGSRAPESIPVTEDSPPGPTEPGADTAPPAQPGPAPGVPPAPATRDLTPPGETAPAEPPPKLPDYLTIVDRFDMAQPTRVDVQVTPPNRLVIDTRNVRRLRIERHKLPLQTHHSISLQLDSQGIEWLANSTAYEFERSTNGAWTPVKPRRP